MTYKKHTDKYTIIIIVQYTIAKNVPFVVQHQENCKNININHSTYQFWL